MSTPSSIAQDLQSSRQAYAVGAKPIPQRAATKWLANAIRLGFVAGVMYGGLQLLPNKAPQVNAFVGQPQVASVQDLGATDLGAPTATSSFEDVRGGVEVETHPTRSRPETWDIQSDVSADETLSSGKPYPLGFEVTAKDTHASLVMKMFKRGDWFQAATLQAEGLETRPYYIEGDPTQPTIGVGYNIKMSATAIGKQGVRQELTKAGVAPKQIDLLLSPDQRQSSQARITPHQAVALLQIATSRFRASTRAAVGPAVFDRKPKHQQAALMMIDYNSNIHRRHDVLQAVRTGNTMQAIESMETYGTVNGKRQRLANSALPQTMYFSADGAKMAIMRPETVKRNVAQGITLWGRSPLSTPQAPSIDSVDRRYAQGVVDHPRSSDPHAVLASQGSSVRVTRVASSPELPPVISDPQDTRQVTGSSFDESQSSSPSSRSPSSRSRLSERFSRFSSQASEKAQSIRDQVAESLPPSASSASLSADRLRQAVQEHREKLKASGQNVLPPEPNQPKNR